MSLVILIRMLTQYVPSVHRPLRLSDRLIGPTLSGCREFRRIPAAKMNARSDQEMRLRRRYPLPKKVSSKSLQEEIQRRADWEKLVRGSLRDMELGNKTQCFRDQNRLILSFLPKIGCRVPRKSRFGNAPKTNGKKPKTNKTKSKTKKLKQKKVVNGKARTVYSNSKGKFVNIKGKRKYIKLYK